MTGTAPRALLPSPEAWRTQLDRRRGEFPVNDPAWDEVRSRFREVTAQTRQLLRRPLEFPILRQLADRALQLSQITFDELNALTQGRPAAAPAALRELLEENRQALEVIAAQQQLLADIHAATEPLHGWAEAITRGGLSSAAPWLEWTHGFAAAIVRDPVTALLPLAGVHLDESLQQAGWNRPQWYAQAVCAARLSAALAERWLDGDPRGTHWLTAAALVHDIGRWNLDGQPARSRRTSTERLRQHPAIGAALLADLPGCPVEIVSLVGTHEERVDGSGTPQCVAGQRLSRRSQLLGLITRISELATSAQYHAAALSQGETLEFTIALPLWRDVRRGAFRESLMRWMLDALEPGLADDVAEAAASRSLLFVDREHAAPHPHHGFPAATPSSPTVPPPTYWRRRRQGVGRWASVSAASASSTGANS